MVLLFTSMRTNCGKRKLNENVSKPNYKSRCDVGPSISVGAFIIGLCRDFRNSAYLTMAYLLGWMI